MWRLKQREKRKSDAMPFPPFSEFKGKKVALIAHAGADVDALASAFVLKKALEEKGAEAEVVVPEHANLSANALAKNTGNDFKVSESIEKFDSIVLVDFNSLDMAGEMRAAIKGFGSETYAIDHHRASESIASPEKSLVKDDAVSSAELVLQLLEKNKVKLSREMGELIAAGIITDSNFFHVADAGTFAFMAEATKASGKRFSEIIALFQVERDVGEKIAKIKAAKRARIFTLGRHVLVVSRVGAFEADAANALVRIGADIAFAGDSEKGKLLVSGRASNSFVNETGFDLARDVFSKLGEFFNGSGGGHAGAAAFNGEGSIEECLEKCVKLASKKIGGKLKEYT